MEEEPEEGQDAALSKCESIAERIRSAAALASAASRGQALEADVEVVNLDQVPHALGDNPCLRLLRAQLRILSQQC